MSANAASPFLEQLAAKTPAPGAGAAAAVAAAMAAALVEMTAGFANDEQMASKAAATRKRLLELAEADAEVYRAVLEAQGEARRDALSRAADVPLEIAETALQLRASSATLLERELRALRGEALAAFDLADAVFRVAAHLVLVNLGEESDDERAAQARALLGSP